MGYIFPGNQVCHDVVPHVLDLIFLDELGEVGPASPHQKQLMLLVCLPHLLDDSLSLPHILCSDIRTIPEPRNESQFLLYLPIIRPRTGFEQKVVLFLPNSIHGLLVSQPLRLDLIVKL